MSKTLVIISCVGATVWDRKEAVGLTMAKDAFVSPYFLACRKFAERFGSHWRVLSAKYGLIAPTDAIEWYEETFDRKSSGHVDKIRLQRQVKMDRLTRYEDVIALGGHKALRMVVAAFEDSPCRIYFPFSGLILGHQLDAIRESMQTGIIPGFSKTPFTPETLDINDQDS